MGILQQSGKNPNAVYMVTQLSCADSKQMAPRAERHLNSDFFPSLGYNSLFYLVQQCLEAATRDEGCVTQGATGIHGEKPHKINNK